MKLGRAALFGAALLMGGCSVAATSSNYREAVNSWVGSSVEQLAQVWGMPDKRIELENNQTVYVYQHELAQTLPGYSQPGQIEVPGPGGSDYQAANSTPYNTYVRNCTTEFVANAKNIITKVLSSGNACKFTQGDKTDYIYANSKVL